MCKIIVLPDYTTSPYTVNMIQSNTLINSNSIER